MCGLLAGPDGYCIFHSDGTAPEFLQALIEQVSNQCWLEGARIKQDLTHVDLSHARLPRANFEGVKLVNVVLNDALLEGSNFRSATLEGVLLNGAKLRGAAFDMAILRKAHETPVDLQNAELGGVSFSGATLQYPRLLGCRFSQPTAVTPLLETPCFEMKTASWDDAATVYAILGKRAADDWDFPSAELCSYLAMTCRHRRAISAGPLPERHQWLSWVASAFTINPKDFFSRSFWVLNRVLWGYGLLPSRAFLTMLFVIVVFWISFFPFAQVEQTSFRLTDTLILSLTTFFSLSYGTLVPSDMFGEIALIVEALFGKVLLALFLVSLAGKYLRRF